MPRTSFRHTIALAITVALGVLTAQAGRAQGGVAPPPYGGQGPTGGYGTPPPPQGFGQGFGPGQQGPGQPPFGGPPALQLPDGVDKIYALEGDNSLVMFGTPEGYQTVRELVRGLDGDLNAIRTQVVLVKVTRTALPGQALTGKALTTGDVQRLLAARLAGQLPGSATVRVTTREDTEVDTVLGKHNDVPLSFVPRLGADGRIVVQMTRPEDTSLAIRSGRTIALALPPDADAAPGEPFSVLFITPTLLKSGARR